MKAGGLLVALGAVLGIGGIAYASASKKSSSDIKPGLGGDHKVTGKSGVTYITRTIEIKSDGTGIVQVLNSSATKLIITYSDKNGKRELITSNPDADPITISKAKTDFVIPITSKPSIRKGQILVEPGSYAANVDVAFPASIVVTTGLLKEGIEKKGFVNVSVTDTRPKNWPVPGESDYYVTASWKKSAVPFDRPGALTDYRKVA